MSCRLFYPSDAGLYVTYLIFINGSVALLKLWSRAPTEISEELLLLTVGILIFMQYIFVHSRYIYILSYMH